jgi:hypothetical protein
MSGVSEAGAKGQEGQPIFRTDAHQQLADVCSLDLVNGRPICASLYRKVTCSRLGA